ncbi:MAG: hypothetical protein MUD01_22855 [Chloroflexaceae bacterium]|nr:hypothetical protein [Chloroflexaceae bacterium]
MCKPLRIAASFVVSPLLAWQNNGLLGRDAPPGRLYHVLHWTPRWLYSSARQCQS